MERQDKKTIVEKYCGRLYGFEEINKLKKIDGKRVEEWVVVKESHTDFRKDKFIPSFNRKTNILLWLQKKKNRVGGEQ